MHTFLAIVSSTGICSDILHLHYDFYFKVKDCIKICYEYKPPVGFMNHNEYLRWQGLHLEVSFKLWRKVDNIRNLVGEYNFNVLRSCDLDNRGLNLDIQL